MRILPVLLTAMLATAITAGAAPSESFPLWPDKAPDALGDKDDDKPTLTPFLPPSEKATGAAIVICPGGGYGGLAAHEGQGYADYLTQQGITCFVLKYRLGSKGYRHPAMLNDAARAVRLVRAEAAKWKIDPHRVAIMGSSAGGHLASTLLTHYDAGKADSPDPVERQSSRPDVGILCYAVITMGEHTHAGSKKNLLGDIPDPKLVELLSNEKQVTKDTPPCFLWHTWEDKGVKIENSLQFVDALQRNNIPFDLHVFQKGGHGIGLSQGKNGVAPDDVHPWGKDLVFWLKVHGFVR
jgi:acetyl esterase/lipase